MYAKSHRHGMSTFAETKGAGDAFAVMWAEKMFLRSYCTPLLNHHSSFGSNESKDMNKERTVSRNSPRRSHQRNGAIENLSEQLQRQGRAMLAALHVELDTDSKLPHSRH